MAEEQADHDAALVEALGEWRTGPEPIMPDLVPGAIAQGTRIRRRNRVRVALSTVAVVAAVAVGGYGVLAPAPEPQGRVLPAEASTGYPSLSLLQSILPRGAGTVGAPQQPGGSAAPGQYFLLTSPRQQVSDLYVSVTRTPAGWSLPSRGAVPCDVRIAQALASPWGGTRGGCAVRPQGPGGVTLEYEVDTKRSRAEAVAGISPYAMGFAYATSEGWLVQVVARPHHATVQARQMAVLDRPLLMAIATDRRLLAPVEKTGDRSDP